MHGDRFAGISEAPLGRYRTQLAAAEVGRIEEALGDAFDRFGWSRGSREAAEPV